MDLTEITGKGGANNGEVNEGAAEPIGVSSVSRGLETASVPWAGCSGLG